MVDKKPFLIYLVLPLRHRAAFGIAMALMLGPFTIQQSHTQTHTLGATRTPYRGSCGESGDACVHACLCINGFQWY